MDEQQNNQPNPQTRKPETAAGNEARGSDPGNSNAGDSNDNAGVPRSSHNLRDGSLWRRGLYTLFFAITYAVAETLLVLIAVFQFFAGLITGRVNGALHRFGANVAQYIYQITQFVTFNSEVTPYPFADWPSTDTGETAWSPGADN